MLQVNVKSIWILAVVAGVCLGPHVAAAADKPLVVLLATGGTIAGAGSSSTDLTNYKTTYTAEQLVEVVPEISNIADVRIEQVFNTGSPSFTMKHWLTLAQRANAVLAEPGVSGVVITHGTSTMEETAYFLNLTVKSEKPVVIVGSMRPATALSADGPLNLYNAFRVAAAPEARDKGVMIVLNDQIDAARDVTKANSYRVETFRSHELGMLGDITEDKVSFYRASTKRHTLHSEFDVGGLTDLPMVDVLYSYVQPNPATVRGLVSSGTTGIVFAGTGAGGISNAEREALKLVMDDPRIKTKPVVVRASRVGSGRVIPTNQDNELDTVAGDTFSPQKARILLMLALTKTRDIKEIRRIFAEY